MDGYQCCIQCLPARAGGQPNMKYSSDCPETRNYDCQ
jgi:hypothetical protein